MKKVFLFTALLITAMTANAQFKPVEKPNNSFKEQMTINGKEFTCNVSTHGAWSIDRISNKGNEYKMYLGYQTEHEYQEVPVFTDKKQEKFWYFTLSKSGYPKKNYLEKE